MRLCWLLLLSAGVLVGCASPPPADPNDPQEVGMVQPEILERSVRWAWEAAETRVVRGEITEAQAQEFTRARADELVAHIDVAKIPTEKAFAYGQVFRTAKRWDDAEELFRRAYAEPASEDVRVNAGLRLAQCLAELDRVDEALKAARSVFDAPDHETAPILPAVLYEIVPAAEGKGHDGELAKLLEDAITQHLRTKIDPKSDAGKNFLIAMGVHVQKAWSMVGKLYRLAKNPTGAERAVEKGMESRASEVRV